MFSVLVIDLPTLNGVVNLPSLPCLQRAGNGGTSALGGYNSAGLPVCGGMEIGPCPLRPVRHMAWGQVFNIWSQEGPTPLMRYEKSVYFPRNIYFIQ